MHLSLWLEFPTYLLPTETAATTDDAQRTMLVLLPLLIINHRPKQDNI